MADVIDSTGVRHNHAVHERLPRRIVAVSHICGESKKVGHWIELGEKTTRQDKSGANGESQKLRR